MKFTIVGLQEVKFNNEKTGELIEGVKLHLVAQKEKKYFIGKFVTTQFITRARFFDGLPVTKAEDLIGQTISIDYNEKGKLDDFELLGKPTATTK